MSTAFIGEGYFDMKGMVKYWELGGVKDDYYIPCANTEKEWFEFNCTYLPNIGKSIVI